MQLLIVAALKFKAHLGRHLTGLLTFGLEVDGHQGFEVETACVFIITEAPVLG